MKNKIIVDAELSNDTVLWRYISLEKLIHLLETSTLFLSPISFFKNSDPLEGHLPKKFHEMIQSDLKSMQDEEIIKFPPETPSEEVAMFEESFETLKNRRVLMEHKVRGRDSICCWFESKFESEAMWKLYGDNGKSIAIKTTVGALKKSIESKDNDYLVHLDRVRYLNFNDDELKQEDLLGKKKELARILLKRKEYEHEKEVRMYHSPDQHDLSNIQRNIFSSYWEDYKIKPYLINVDTNQLIDSIVISPYVSEPYPSSVKAVCRKYELNDCNIYQSSLLAGYDF